METASSITDPAGNSPSEFYSTRRVRSFQVSSKRFLGFSYFLNVPRTQTVKIGNKGTQECLLLIKNGISPVCGLSWRHYGGGYSGCQAILGYYSCFSHGIHRSAQLSAVLGPLHTCRNLRKVLIINAETASTAPQGSGIEVAAESAGPELP